MVDILEAYVARDDKVNDQMGSKGYADTYFQDLAQALDKTLSTDLSGANLSLDSALMSWVDKAYQVREQQGIFFFVGNGASATMAEHLSHDCFQNADMLTETVSETSHLTAISNDISFEQVFSYRIQKMAHNKDMLVTISSSGNSPNVIAAIKAARDKGMFVVTLSGKGADNASRSLGNLNFYVPLATYGMVESAHSALLHCWLDLFMDTYLEGRH